MLRLKNRIKSLNLPRSRKIETRRKGLPRNRKKSLPRNRKKRREVRRTKKIRIKEIPLRKR